MNATVTPVSEVVVVGARCAASSPSARAVHSATGALTGIPEQAMFGVGSSRHPPPAFHAASATGKFHGVIAATTPSGRRTTST